MEKNGKIGKGLSPRQQMAVVHMARGCGLNQTAKKIGVTRQTIRNWTVTEEFQAALAMETEKLASEVRRWYQSIEVEIFTFLQSVMNDPREKTPYRIDAAKMLSVRGDALRDQEEFKKRLDELENRLPDSEAS